MGLFLAGGVISWYNRRNPAQHKANSPLSRERQWRQVPEFFEHLNLSVPAAIRPCEMAA